MLLKDGCMELAEFSSNHPDVMTQIPEALRAKTVSLDLDKDGTIKTLGVHWNPVADVFSFKVNMESINSRQDTKRSLLSEMARTFDPLGWLSPVTVRAKILFQQMWKSDAGWDDPLPHHIRVQWEAYKASLHKIEEIQIRRCISPAASKRITLHGFGDASEKAYAAAVYVKAEQSQGSPVISLVAAKTKVAPCQDSHATKARTVWCCVGHQATEDSARIAKDENR